MFMDIAENVDKVSIIIPVFNGEAFIERSILSAENQTYKNTEIIVVNDGSTDRTDAIAKVFCEKYSNIKLISIANQGVSHARNIGIEKSTGVYITFLDADDELIDTAVQTMVDTIRETHADICAGNHVLINTDGQEKTPSVYRDYKGYGIFAGKDALIKSIEDDPCTYSAWSKLYTRETISSARFPEGRRQNEDSYFVFLVLLKNIRMVVVDKTVYKQHVNMNSVTHSKVSDSIFDITDLADQKVRMINERYPDLGDKARNITIKANMSLLA